MHTSTYNLFQKKMFFIHFLIVAGLLCFSTMGNAEVVKGCPQNFIQCFDKFGSNQLCPGFNANTTLTVERIAVSTVQSNSKITCYYEGAPQLIVAGKGCTIDTAQKTFTCTSYCSYQSALFGQC